MTPTSRDNPALLGKKAGLLDDKAGLLTVAVSKERGILFAASMGKSMENSDSCMCFDTCESSKRMHSAPLPRLGILGAMGDVIS